jgi:hypothetical protein
MNPGVATPKTQKPRVAKRAGGVSVDFIIDRYRAANVALPYAEARTSPSWSSFDALSKTPTRFVRGRSFS